MADGQGQEFQDGLGGREAAARLAKAKNEPLVPRLDARVS
jgi:hypothetical protein